MIKTLRLQNFRSYADYTTELDDGVNIVVGPNASGKTNLLEAIYVANRGKSFRVSDKNLIKNGETWARIDVRGDDGRRAWKLEVKEEKPVRLFDVNDTQMKRLTKKYQQPTTLFEPNHLRLLSGSPETRRAYLDQILSQTDQEFSDALRKYGRALKQRNSLLKQTYNTTQDDMFVWDVKLSEYGAVVYGKRIELIKYINTVVADKYSKIARSKTKIVLEYVSTISSKDYVSGFLKTLQETLAEDKMRGFTTHGPHREDFKVYMNGEESSVMASRGETRTLVLALKLIELKLLEDELEQKPLLLLDDVFSELDGKRRKALTEHISKYQTLITTTDAEAVIEHFNTGEYRIIPTTTN